MTPRNPFYRHGRLKTSLLFLDLAAITLAAVSTYVLHYYAGFEIYDVHHAFVEYLSRILIFYASAPILIFLFRQNLLYKHKVYSSAASQFALLLRSVLINSLILIAVLFFIREDVIQHSRINLLFFSSFVLLYCSLGRIVIFRKYILQRLSSKDTKRVLVVGIGETLSRLLSLPEQNGSAPYEVAAIVDSLGKLASGRFEVPEHIPVLRNVDSLAGIVQKHNIHEVYIAEDDLPYEDVIQVISQGRTIGVPINLLSGHFKVIHERITRGTSEFFNISTAPLSFGAERPYSQFIKRLVDIGGSSFGILFLTPFWVLCAILVKSSGAGPLFFRTTVIGQNGRAFTWFKFRTMRSGTAHEDHKRHVEEHIKLGTRPTGKLQNDPRVTGIGKWLRKHSLDELPQLVNVLKGDMSLVGPRPCLPYEYEQYQDWHKERFAVRPGITGLWQVSGRSAVSFNDMVILDLYYINNMSLWLDAAILFRTIGVVLSGRGGG